MGLPFARNQTYTAGVTEVAAADVNAIQDGIVRHESMLAGSAFFLGDDFTGSAVDTGKWSTTGSPVVANDGTLAFGSLRCQSTVNGTSVFAITNTIPISTSVDFRWTIRFRLNAITPATGDIHFGLNGNCYIVAENGHANWRFRYAAGASVVDTSIALTDTTNYHTVSVRRTTGVLYLSVDGTETTIGADTTSSSNGFIAGFAEDLGTTADLYVDMAKIWVNR